MYDSRSLCAQVTFEKAQLCDMPPSLEKDIAKGTKFLNTPQQTQNFPKQCWDGKFPELTCKPMGGCAWAWEMNQEKHRLIHFHSDPNWGIFEAVVSSNLSVGFLGPMLII